MANVDSGYNFWTEVPASSVLHRGYQAEGCESAFW